MFDVITFGSATNDIFLKLKSASQKNNEVCFALGEKFGVEETQVFSGGGGTNTACTFALQGLEAAYLGKVGEDLMAEIVLQDLQEFKVVTKFVQRNKELPTALSVILSPQQGDRTILTGRGACHSLSAREISWQKIKKTKWFYVAPLYGKAKEILEPLVKFAKENKIKVAVNLSDEHIAFGQGGLKNILGRADVLILNLEEARELAQTKEADEEAVIKKLIFLAGGLVAITLAERGSIVTDGKNIFTAGVSRRDFVEKTGAGDAYGSGFVAGLLQKNNIEYGIQLATANSESCIQKIGAKNGLLKKDNKSWHKVKVIKKPFLYR